MSFHFHLVATIRRKNAPIFGIYRISPYLCNVNQNKRHLSDKRQETASLTIQNSTEMKKEEEKKEEKKKVSDDELENVNGGFRVIVW